MAEDFSYCAQVVKDHDPDRFMIAMLCDAKVREDIFALLAFNHEIAKTREVVSETMLGQIRLQWWRERLDEIFKGARVPENEILKALKVAIENHGLSQEEFETLIYAREFDLEDILPSNEEGFLNYIDFTSTPLNSLILKILDVHSETEPLRQVSMNYALVGLMRAIPVHARQRRCYIPQDLMTQHGLRTSLLYDFKPQERLSECVSHIMNQHVVLGLKPESRYLKGLNALSLMYFSQIQNAGFDVFSQRLIVPPAFKALRLLFKTLF